MSCTEQVTQVTSSTYNRKAALAAYKQFWDSPGHVHIELEERYGNGRNAYLGHFPLRGAPHDDSEFTMEELGMQAFIRLEAKLLQGGRKKPYWNSGRKALEAFSRALSSGVWPSGENSDFVFVAIEMGGCATATSLVSKSSAWQNLVPEHCSRPHNRL